MIQPKAQQYLFRNAVLNCLVCMALSGVYGRTVDRPSLLCSQALLEFPETVISGANTIYIPFRFVGRLITIEARIDTVSGSFLFDTGAERLVLNRAYFDPDQMASVSSFGSSGQVGLAQHKQVDSMHIDRILVLDLSAHVVDLSHIESKKNVQLRGILGYDVFKDFEVLIDYPSRIITLSRLDKRGSPLEPRRLWEQKMDSIDFFLDQHMIIFNGEVGGKKLRLMLDTGAEVNLLDRLVGRRVLRHFQILRRINMTGVGKTHVEVLAGVLTGMKCSQQEPKQMYTLLTNLDAMNQAFRSNVQGVVGYEFLFDKRILINYKKEMMYFLVPNRP